MDKLVIDAKVRTETGKGAARRLRETGLLPAVMYNESAENTMLTVDEVQFNKVWRSITKTTLVTLNVDGKEYDAFIRDVEWDIKTDKVLHVDFWVVSNTKPVTFTFKVQYTGTAAGVLKGGFMVKHQPSLTLKALPKNIPARLVLDVSKINIGDHFLVKNLELGEGIEVLENPETDLVSVAPAR